jgi:hypothetical protein
MIHLLVVMNKTLSFNVKEMKEMHLVIANKKTSEKNLNHLNVVDYLYLQSLNSNVQHKEMNQLLEAILDQSILLNVLINAQKNQEMFGELVFMLICPVFVKPVSIPVLYKIQEVSLKWLLKRDLKNMKPLLIEILHLLSMTNGKDPL